MAAAANELASIGHMARRAILLLNQRWWILAVAIFTCGGMASAYAFLATPIYQASVVLAPVRQSEFGGGLAALLGQFGELATLAGAGVGNGGDVQNALAILRSRAFAENLLNGNQLMPYLFPEQWHNESGSWLEIEDHGTPTMDDAWLKFNKSVRKITQDQRTGLVTISIRLADRRAAADTANALVYRINDEVKRRVISEAEASRQYLERQLSGTTEVELRQAIYRLIELQIRRQVLASTRQEFAFVLIDPATVPDQDKYDSPKRGLLIAIGLVLGMMLGLFAILVSQLVRPMRT